MRSYSIDITNANDDIVAFWSKLDETQLVAILTTIVPMKHYFISVHVHLEFDK